MSSEEVRRAPVVLYGDARHLKTRFPKETFPSLIGGVAVESPSKEQVHYLSLLKWDSVTEHWRPAEDDPRGA
jgi:hypothetical protein